MQSSWAFVNAAPKNGCGQVGQARTCGVCWWMLAHIAFRSSWPAATRTIYISIAHPLLLCTIRSVAVCCTTCTVGREAGRATQRMRPAHWPHASAPMRRRFELPACSGGRPLHAVQQVAAADSSPPWPACTAPFSREAERGELRHTHASRMGWPWWWLRGQAGSGPCVRGRGGAGWGVGVEWPGSKAGLAACTVHPAPAPLNPHDSSLGLRWQKSNLVKHIAEPTLLRGGKSRQEWAGAVAPSALPAIKAHSYLSCLLSSSC